ncbi:MAG TPA: hypothetical protein VFC63_27545 [Blastocatellia bacterium]|nr:hypothetical protein [Blastocatellia bacterium]
MNLLRCFKTVVFCLWVLESMIVHASSEMTMTMHESTREQIVKIVKQIQRADYEGNRAQLKKLYHDLDRYVNDKQFEAKVRYWRGFAMWRMALNGFNDSIDFGELDQELKQAVTEFQFAIDRDTGFNDAKTAAAACLESRMYIHQNDKTLTQDLLNKVRELLREAKDTDPENPRLLWVLGAGAWYIGAENGGGEDKALEIYNRGLKVARERRSAATDPLNPSWGEPELLMNLAWSNLNLKNPNPTAAEEYAKSALAIVPYWHYVKDILMPQITAAKGK